MMTQLRKSQNQMLMEGVQNICKQVVHNGLSPELATEILYSNYASRFATDVKGDVEETFVCLFTHEISVDDAVETIMSKRSDFLG